MGGMTANAHVNDKGMDYDSYKTASGHSCCDDSDCKPALDFIEATQDGKPVVRLLIDGLWVTFERSYVVANFATDGRAHFCGRLRISGNPPKADPDTVCIILPSRDM